ncbi:MAG: NAD-dependent epimerase/dehydratase family protein [Legionellaceae bacterium]|nr:NAD-dependent epimerase/dehydratase family protein [Legionellaceae bacterium]MBP9775848.1 NAD-dependent epimerase/dehydratase family protein [Legionellaceae bacterium]
MTILITGVAGFIGSFLAEHLIEGGYKVIGVDNLFRGKLENIQHLPKTHFEFLKLDLSQAKHIKRIRDLLLKHHITTVFHLAAINGTQYFYDKPFFVLDQNIKITQNLLESTLETQVKYIIYTSSSEVYGEATQFPTPETHPISVHEDIDRDSYAASKALGEFYVRLFSQLHQIDYLILRVFNIYGERMVGTRYGQVIPEFINKMQSPEKFTIIGDGKQTRSFCYIRDLIYILKTLMQKQTTGLMNIGNDDEISIAELAQNLHQLAGRAFEPTYLSGRPNDHQRRKPDLSHLRRVLPELVFTPLEKGLIRTLAFYTALPRRGGEK